MPKRKPSDDDAPEFDINVLGDLLGTFLGSNPLKEGLNLGNGKRLKVEVSKQASNAKVPGWAKTLGFGPNEWQSLTMAQLTKRQRELAKTCHPDAAKNARDRADRATRLSQINQAVTEAKKELEL